MDYGDVCLSSLWVSYNVNRTRLLNLSSATYFFVSWATPNGKLLAGLGKSQDITLNTDQRNTLNYKHLASTLNKYCVQFEPTSCYNYILFVKGNNLLNIKDC